MGGINSINQFNDPIVTPVNTCMGIQDKKTGKSFKLRRTSL